MASAALSESPIGSLSDEWDDSKFSNPFMSLGGLATTDFTSSDMPGEVDFGSHSPDEYDLMPINDEVSIEENQPPVPPLSLPQNNDVSDSTGGGLYWKKLPPLHSSLSDSSRSDINQPTSTSLPSDSLSRSLPSFDGNVRSPVVGLSPRCKSGKKDPLPRALCSPDIIKRTAFNTATILPPIVPGASQPLETEQSSEEFPNIKQKKAGNEIRRIYAKCKDKKDFSKMIKYINNVFASLKDIYLTFKISQDNVKDDTHNIELEKLTTFNELLLKVPREVNIEKIVLKNLVNCLLDAPEPKKATTDTVRVYFILLQVVVFETTSSYVIFSHLIRLIASLLPEHQHSLLKHFTEAGTNSIKSSVRLLRRFIDKRLFPPSPDVLPPAKKCSWWIPLAARIMSLLFASNQSHATKTKVALKEFYCNGIEKLDLKDDFNSWVKKDSSKGFIFCQYSFLISSVSKRQLLSADFEQQMLMSAKNEIESKLKKKQQPTMNMLFVELEINRATLIRDSLNQIIKKQNELKKKLRINFIGEEGVDLGGLTKEWFLLLTREIFSPDYGMFIYNQESRTFWFNGSNKDSMAEFFLIGALMGLAIYNSIILDIRFPRCCYKKLLSPAVMPNNLTSEGSFGMASLSLKDYDDYAPDAAKGLKDLLSYEGDAEDMCLTFTASVPNYDATKTYSLKRNGNNITVNNSTKKEYVSRYVHFMLNQWIEKQFTAFYKGFHVVCDSKVLEIVQAEELETIICGEPLFDVSSLKRSTKYKGYKQTDSTIEYFWEVLNDMSSKKIKKFLSFLTGSDRIPVGGAVELDIKISRMNSSEESNKSYIVCEGPYVNNEIGSATDFAVHFEAEGAVKLTDLSEDNNDK